MPDEVEIVLPTQVETALENVVAEQVAEERAEDHEDRSIELEQSRIDAEVAKVAITADASVEIERLRAEGAKDDGEDDRWSTLETFCLTTLDTLATLEASNLQLHRQVAELQGAADGRKERSEELPASEAVIEPEPPIPDKPASEENPPPPSEQRTRRRLIV